MPRSGRRGSSSGTPVGPGLAAGLVVAVTFLAPIITAQSLWEPVVGGGATMPSGFGDPLNFGTRSIAWFGDQVFVGVSCTGFSSGLNCPMKVWSLAADDTWTQITNDGFGHPENSWPGAMIDFMDHLYISTIKRGTSYGGELWRSADGVSWEQVSETFLGDDQFIIAMAEFNQHLYAGTLNLFTGAQVWRSPDGTSWTQLIDDGFGDTDNYGVASFGFFGQDLLVATEAVNECEIWSSTDGTSWIKFSNCPDPHSSINPFAAYAMKEVFGALYVGTTDSFVPGGIWQSVDGLYWNEVADDESWESNSITGMAYHDAQLFVAAGKNVLTVESSIDWKIDMGDGFGNSNNMYIWSMTFAGPYLYAGTGNTDDGTEIWRTAKRLFGDGFESGTTMRWSASEPSPPIINEIMQNPSAVPDSDGEWFEIFNPGTVPFDIDGWIISDNDSDSHTISNGGPLVIPGGGFLVFGAEGDPFLNGGVAVDYIYSNVNLANTSDQLFLSTASGNEIDRVEWDGGGLFPNPSGASMILADPTLDNNNGLNWCISTSVFGDGDLGTPGAVNDACP